MEELYGGTYRSQGRGDGGARSYDGSITQHTQRNANRVPRVCIYGLGEGEFVLSSSTFVNGELKKNMRKTQNNFSYDR